MLKQTIQVPVSLNTKELEFDTTLRGYLKEGYQAMVDDGSRIWIEYRIQRDTVISRSLWPCLKFDPGKATSHHLLIPSSASAPLTMSRTFFSTSSDSFGG